MDVRWTSKKCCVNLQCKCRDGFFSVIKYISWKLINTTQAFMINWLKIKKKINLKNSAEKFIEIILNTKMQKYSIHYIVWSKVGSKSLISSFVCCVCLEDAFRVKELLILFRNDLLLLLLLSMFLSLLRSELDPNNFDNQLKNLFFFFLAISICSWIMSASKSF